MLLLDFWDPATDTLTIKGRRRICYQLQRRTSAEIKSLADGGGNALSGKCDSSLPRELNS